MADKRKADSRTPMLEWIAAITGALLIAGLFGVIAYEGWRGGSDEAPAIELSVLRVAPAVDGYRVEIEASNRSGGTAQSLEVEGALSLPGMPAETSSVTLDYVPGHSRRSGGLYFRNDPRQGRLILRPLGYQVP